MPAPRTVSDGEFVALARACELASRGAGTALPNPVVGCVILNRAGEVVGEGFHERAGGPHAEVAALAHAGPGARGATAVVTLEPCNHTGRTGPCSQALIDAGISRVVAGVRDPWPRAAGGIERLRAAGIEVVDLSHDAVRADALSGGGGGDEARIDIRVRESVAVAEDVNRVWLRSVATARPFVTLKMATSIDGRVAAPDGSSRWISGVGSREHAHRMRERVDVMMVGVGTVLADDPQLTARRVDGTLRARQPLRVVVDTHGRTPAGAAIRSDAAPTLIATGDACGLDAAGHVDLVALLDSLYRDGRRHVLLEGGPRLAAAFLDVGLVDEVLLYLAPMLLGAGRSALEGGGIARLGDAHHFEVRSVERLGPDLLVRYSRHDAASSSVQL